MKKRISCLCIVAGMVLALAGCSDKNGVSVTKEVPTWEKYKEEPVTLDWYINFSWYTTPWGQNAVSRAITDETGVNVKFIVPTGNESQKLKTMIASNTLPDLITLGWWETDIQTMVNKDMVYALNELADEYDAYFYQVIDEEVARWYTEEDGNLYCYPNSACTLSDYNSGKSEGANLNFLVRKDIYEAIGSPDMTTPEGYTEAVKKAKEMFPEVNGEPLIPIGGDAFTANGCNSFDKYLQNFLAVPYEKDGVYNDRYLDEDFINWLKVFRQLNEEGYLSEEIFIDTRAQLEEKMAMGQYFCMIYQGTDIEASEKILYENNPDSIYIAVEGPRNSKGDNPVLPNTGINGWTVTLVSKNCKDPQRAISFLSYLMSEEGQKMTYLGVEGITYEEVDGEYILNPEVEKLLEKDRNEYDRLYGADNAYWMLQNNVMQSQWPRREDNVIQQLREWTIPYTAYISQYEVVLEAESPLANARVKIDEEWGKTLPLLLLADSEEEFDQYLEAYRKKKYELGYEELKVEYTRQMQEAKVKLGIHK